MQFAKHRIIKPVKLILPWLHDKQREFVDDQHRFVFAACGSKLGKGLPLDATVYTPIGPKPMGALSVGDIVCTPSGVSAITGVYPQGNRPLFEIRFNDNSFARCDDEHLWEVHDAKHGTHRLMSTTELSTASLRSKYIQVAAAEFETQDTPIDPYVLGVLLGDGCFRHPDTIMLSSADQEIVDRVATFTNVTKCEGDNYDYRLGVNTLHAVKALGLFGLYSHEKFIPDCYRYNSRHVRMEILRGLLDTDGTVERKNGQPRFEQTSPLLAEQVADIVRSLGGLVRTKIKLNGRFKTVYRQSIVVKDATEFFSLQRKKSIAKAKKKTGRRYIKSVTRCGEAETQCIKIADSKGLFFTNDFAVTHNTFGLANWIIREAWNREQSLLWWCAPVYKQAQIAFKLIGNLLPPGRYKKRGSAGEMTYELLYTDGRTRSIIDFKSAERPESLRGEGVHGAVVDEAGYWKRDSFVSVLTTLTRTKGKLRVISTPKGRNWFWEEWMKGWDPEQRKKNPEYWSYQLPTWVNPFIDAEQIETLRRVFTKKQFAQEICAEFLEDGAGVFSNVKSSQKVKLLDAPLLGRRYVIGIDWAKQDDYTVFLVMDSELRKVVHIARHHGLDWNVNIDKAIRLAKEWNRASIIMDSTGVGDVPFDTVAATYPMCEGYNIYNNEPKVALIQRLQLALERNEIHLPVAFTDAVSPLGYSRNEDPIGAKAEVGSLLENELMMYSSSVTRTGKFQYSAPEGFHDDLVIALALATWKCCEEPMVYRFDSIRGL